MMPDADIVSVVERLIAAENARDAAASAAELAAGFVGITRARNVEQDRAAMLEEVANPANPGLVRELEDGPTVWQSGDLAVVRSVVDVLDGSSPPIVTRFRNLHVLTREAGAWTCLAWQVTRIG